MRLIGALLAIALVFGGCRDREAVVGEDGVSGTIAPAEPQPAPTGTEAMTQTVNIEDSRTDAEGGVLVDPDATDTVTTDTATTATAPRRPPTP